MGANPACSQTASSRSSQARLKRREIAALPKPAAGRCSGLDCLTRCQARRAASPRTRNPEDIDRLELTLEENAEEPMTCSFFMNRCPERDSNPQGLLHQILRMCTRPFLTFLGVYRKRGKYALMGLRASLPALSQADAENAATST
jgi:hypothetical protein